MRLLLAILFLFPFALMAHSNGSRVEPKVSIEGDVVLMKRTGGVRRDLVILRSEENITPIFPINPINGLTPLDPVICKQCQCTAVIKSRMLVGDFDYEPGGRVLFTYNHSPYWSWDASFTGIFHWRGKKTVVCPFNISFPFKPNPTFDYLGADKARTVLKAELWTADSSFWYHITPRRVDYFSLSWLAGFRFYHYDEALKMTFQEDCNKSDWLLTTNNNLFGIQSGFDFQCNPYHCLTWGIQLKAGAMINDTRSRSFLRDKNNTVCLIDASFERSIFSYFVEAMPFLNFYILPKVALSLNWQWTLIGNISEAANQITTQYPFKPHLDWDGKIKLTAFVGGLRIDF